MVDITDSATRSRMMSGIRGKNTKPEILVRKALHKRGLRFRLHSKNLPGTPDLIFPRFKAAVFVHGCFWHQHNCTLSKMPATRVDYWKQKFSLNKERDFKQVQLLIDSGWRVAVIWECALRGKGQQNEVEIFDMVSNWIQTSDCSYLEI